MRKRVLIIFIVSLLIFNLSFVLSANETDDETSSDNETVISEEEIVISEEGLSDVDRAFNCLKNSVDGKCSTLSFEEKIFTTLALGECVEELKDSSNDGRCWPSSGCNVKDTALAIWALDERGVDTQDAQDWLFTQNATPTEVSWFLEIESSEESTCKISYSGSDYTIAINEDKIISSDAGACLSKSNDGYWLRVSPSCYSKEFEISCNNDFLTTLLYKRRDSSIIHVSEKTQSSSAEGLTSEKVNAVCFGNSGTCDYEGSLWASLILDTRSGKDYSLSSYFPYLVTMMDQNEEYLPESFLYLLLGHEDFRNDLLLKQRSSKYWDESGNKFYDTALALLPFSGSSLAEKQGSIDWLLEIQEDGGCFNNNNKRDTAFLLYSLWLDRAPSPENPIIDSKPDCEASGHYCMTGTNCATGNILSGYKCSNLYKCCSVPAVEKTCSDMSGEVCFSNEICTGREDNEASDLTLEETCCIGGDCEPKIISEEPTCEENGYTCEILGCGGEQEEVTYETCESESATCCRDADPVVKKDYLWLWIVLILLIIVIIVAIIFREKLRPFWYSLSGKFKKGGSGSKPSGQFPKRPSSSFGRPMPNRPQMRPGMRPPQRRPQMRPGMRRPQVRPLQRQPQAQSPQVRPNPTNLRPNQNIPQSKNQPMQKKTLPMNRPVPKINPINKPRPELNETLGKLKDMSKKQ